MKTVLFETPGLYGDHHVIEVKKQLLSAQGIKDVYASSAFRVVEVTFDEATISQESILEKLNTLGYLNETPYVTEGREASNYFRHTATYATTRKTVAFQQNVWYSGRPLWTCPGIGTIKPMDN